MYKVDRTEYRAVLFAIVHAQLKATRARGVLQGVRFYGGALSPR